MKEKLTYMGNCYLRAKRVQVDRDDWELQVDLRSKGYEEANPEKRLARPWFVKEAEVRVVLEREHQGKYYTLTRNYHDFVLREYGTGKKEQISLAQARRFAKDLEDKKYTFWYSCGDVWMERNF